MLFKYMFQTHITEKDLKINKCSKGKIAYFETSTIVVDDVCHACGLVSTVGDILISIKFNILVINIKYKY